MTFAMILLKITMYSYKERKLVNSMLISFTEVSFIKASLMY